MMSVACLGVFLMAIPVARAQEGTDDLASRLGLADLAAYRAALSGRATAEGDPAPRDATFRDLWDHPDAWRGRRVVIRGRPVRTFRQPAFGDFPALVEAWLSTPRGDLFCAVFPQGKDDGNAAPAPAAGEVRFTGTFLKTIRYPAADAERLAPLVVGERAPAAAAAEKDVAPAAETAGGAGHGLLPWLLGAAAAGLAVLAIVLARSHVNTPAPSRRRKGKGSDASRDDPPLEFLDPEA